MTKYRKYHSAALIFLFFFTVEGHAQPVTRDTVTRDTVEEGQPGFLSDPLYRDLLNEGLERQALIDSLSDWAIESRRQAGAMSSTFESYRLRNRIRIIEDTIRILEVQADSIFRLVTALESGILRSARPFLVLDTVINGIRVYHYDLDNLPPAGQEETVPPPGLVRIERGQGPVAKDARVNGAITGRPSTGDTEPGFMILDASPYSGEHYFDSLFSIPAGVFYWIQLAAFSNPPDPDYFGGIWPVTMVRDHDLNLVRYYAGRFTSLEKARSALGDIKRMGIGDAFIMAYYNGQKISLSRAEQYELREK